MTTLADIQRWEDNSQKDLIEVRCGTCHQTQELERQAAHEYMDTSNFPNLTRRYSAECPTCKTVSPHLFIRRVALFEDGKLWEEEE